MFNTPGRAATSTRSRKRPQLPKPSAFSALIITDGTMTVCSVVGRGPSVETASINSNRAYPPSVFDPISLDGTHKEESS
jgi:hypothetical protein